MTTYTLAPCPFCHAPAHARACEPLRVMLFASDPAPPVPPGQDEYPGIDYPEDEK